MNCGLSISSKLSEDKLRPYEKSRPIGANFMFAQTSIAAWGTHDHH